MNLLHSSRATVLTEEALALAREVGDAWSEYEALHGLGVIALLQSDLRRAQDLLEQSLAGVRALRDDLFTAEILQTLGMVVVQQGDHVRGRAMLEESLEQTRTFGDPAGTAWNLAVLADVVHRLGDLPRATAHLEEARGLIHTIGFAFLTHWIEFNFGQVALSQGDLPRTRMLLETSLAGALTIEDFSLASGILDALGDMARAEGNPEEAIVRYREALGTLWAAQEPVPMDVATRLRSIAAAVCDRGGGQAAARLFGAAEAVRAAHDASFLGTEVRSRGPELAALQDRLGEAAFLKARDFGQALPLADAVAEALALVTDSASPYPTPASVPSPLPDPLAAYGLSSREREVLRLLAQRRTTNEIAEALFVSPHTVHRHTTNLFTKLGIGNRREAAALAARHGPI